MAYFSFVLFGNNMVTACVESIKRSFQFSARKRPLQEVWGTLVGAKNIKDFVCSAHYCINKYTKLKQEMGPQSQIIADQSPTVGFFKCPRRVAVDTKMVK